MAYFKKMIQNQSKFAKIAPEGGEILGIDFFLIRAKQIKKTLVSSLLDLIVQNPK